METQSLYESQVISNMKKGLDQDQPAHKIDPEAWSEVENMWSLNGRKQRRTGYIELGGNLPLNGAFMRSFLWYTLDGTAHFVCFTTRDAYEYNSGTDDWDFITEIYITGQASCAAGTAVTGNGTSWDTSWPANVCQIKFQTQDPNGTGTPDTWYTIASVGGAAAITLSSNGPNTGGDVNYVIRVCWSGDESDRFRLAPVTDPTKNRLYVVNDKDPIKYWTGSNYFVELTGVGVPDTCRDLLWFENRLVCYNTVESTAARPQRVRRSVLGDPDDFNGSGSGFNDLVEDEHEIVAAYKLGTGVAIYKEGSIPMQYYTGETNIYSFEYMSTNLGISAPDAVVAFDQYHVVFGSKDAFLFNGTTTITPITKGIRTRIFGESGELNPTYKDRAFMVYIKDIDKVLVFFPTSTAYPTRVYSVNVLEGSQEPVWDKHLISNMTGFGFWNGATAKPWTSLIGTWAAQTWRYNDKALAGASDVLVLGDKDGYVYKFDLSATEDNGTDIDIKLRTMEWIVPGKKVRYGNFKFQASGGNIDLYYSRNGGNSWSLLKSFTLASSPATYKVFINKVLERLLLEFRGAGQGFALDWYETPHKIKELRA